MFCPGNRPSASSSRRAHAPPLSASRTSSGDGTQERLRSPGADAVEPRTTSSGMNTNSLCGAGVPPISSSSVRTAACPIAGTGLRTVVSGGSVKAISGESSKPTTEMSRGTSRPRCRADRIAPSAIMSLAHTTAVQSRSISAPAAAWPPALQAGVEAPEDLDDLKTAAATIKAKTGVDGFWGSTAGYYAQPFLYGEGTDMVDAEAKKITIKSAEAKKAYGTWLSLFDGKGLHKADVTADAYAHIQDAFGLRHAAAGRPDRLHVLLPPLAEPQRPAARDLRRESS
ncbi:hypothetical protein STENM223S_10314 [Streptomyces tendae]